MFCVSVPWLQTAWNATCVCLDVVCPTRVFATSSPDSRGATSTTARPRTTCWSPPTPSSSTSGCVRQLPCAFLAPSLHLPLPLTLSPQTKYYSLLIERFGTDHFYNAGQTILPAPNPLVTVTLSTALHSLAPALVWLMSETA